jgi:ATP-dependent DNA ligase
VPSFDAEAAEVLEECARLPLEGLVANRVDSRYEQGEPAGSLAEEKRSDWREHHGPHATSGETDC